MNPPRRKLRVLLTGAAGYIGGLVVSHLSDSYEWILTDRKPPADARGLPFRPADIADLDALRPLCRGMDAVLHLAATPDMNAAWEELLPSNIVGTYNILQAAAEAGCRRVVFASSIHVVDGNEGDAVSTPGAPVAPLTLYGASKAWGEAAAAFFARQKGLSVLCLRIGWVTPRDGPHIVPGMKNLEDVITHEDLIRLIAAALDAPGEVRFGIFYGVSDNRPNRYDIRNARERLGYEPQDDAFVLAEGNYSAIGRHWAKRAVRKARKVLHIK
jgi:nucleoside-diphosphate-sugar epimerase